jgi:hypothetical protein
VSTDRRWEKMMVFTLGAVKGDPLDTEVSLPGVEMRAVRLVGGTFRIRTTVTVGTMKNSPNKMDQLGTVVTENLSTNEIVGNKRGVSVILDMDRLHRKGRHPKSPMQTQVSHWIRVCPSIVVRRTKSGKKPNFKRPSDHGSIASAIPVVILFFSSL